MKIQTILIIVSLVYSAIGLFAQKVIVSPEINMRNTQLYALIGQIDETILFFQDRASEKKVILFDENLQLQSERQITLADDRAIVLEAILLDTVFGVIYGYREEDQQVLSLSTFNKRAETQDTIEIARYAKEWRGLNYEVIISENRSKLCLYNILSEDEIRIIVVDLVTRKTMTDNEYRIKNVDLDDELVDIKLSDRGELFLLTETNNNKANKANHTASIFHFIAHTASAQQIIIPIPNFMCADLKLAVNNASGEIGIAGLCDEKRNFESSQYLWVTARPDAFVNVPINLIEINEQILFEVYGDKGRSRLENFIIKDIFWLQNSEAILVLEMQVDLSRRLSSGATIASQTTFAEPTNYGGWSDHYREDLILLGMDRQGLLKWHQVFYKKQFSQNDDAIFSSYFPFMTPSRIRLIYNDEIKNNSTVSEYIFDSKGDYKRTSVLSTEYQNLRLRFIDALQLSATELLVPSQSSFALSLVKIDYGK